MTFLWWKTAHQLYVEAFTFCILQQRTLCQLKISVDAFMNLLSVQSGELLLELRFQLEQQLRAEDERQARQPPTTSVCPCKDVTEAGWLQGR